jgi:PAS domain S-box-containing protein
MSTTSLPSTALYKLAQTISVEGEGGIEQIADVLRILEMLDELAIVTDPQGIILYANTAAERSTGYRVNEIIGKTPTLWGGQMDAGFYQEMWRTITEQKTQFQATLRNKRKDGTLYDAEVRIMPVVGTGDTIRFFLGVERDVSAVQQLQRAQREFIALASHNLKTPLASMRWYAEMLLDNDAGKLSTSQREYVQEIHDASKRMVALIQQWLTINRIDLGLYVFHNEAMNVDDVVQEVLSEMRQRIEERHLSAHFKVGISSRIMVADRDAIKTIVHTLVLNAIKYNNDGGSITIETTFVPAHQEYAGKSFDTTRLALSVCDTGMGIPSEEQGQVFQQFFRGSNVERMQSEGAGLGLFLTHQLITTLGGDIWFSSSEAGSQFYIALPTNSVVSDDADDTEERT